MTEAKTLATGTFEATLTPTSASSVEGIRSISLVKIYHGDLEGTSRGEMLLAGDPEDGDAGYVAIEIVTATLAGRTGSFALMHAGTAENREEAVVRVMVVPGTPAGELAGLRGSMTIAFTAGDQHPYSFEFEFSTAGAGASAGASK
jgi:hypothetical protein